MGDVSEHFAHSRPRQVNVLLSGFGAFRSTKRNPSWETVKLVDARKVPSRHQGTTISVDIAYIPVDYDYVGKILAYYHGNSEDKPEIPANVQADHEIFAKDDFVPHRKYDLVIHVGQGKSGGIKLETIGHQLGYRLLDANGNLAKVVDGTIGATDSLAQVPEQYLSDSERASGMNRGYQVSNDAKLDFSEDRALQTTLDTASLAHELSKEFPTHKISPSHNAGRYLCEYIFFGSMYEALLAQEKSRAIGGGYNAPKVLFVHVPPENDPMTINDMADVLVGLIQRIASQLNGGLRDGL